MRITTLIKKAGTLKEELKGILIIGTLILIFLSLIVKKYDNKRYLIFSVFSLQGSPPFLKLDFGLCARVSPRFSFPLSPRSNFPPGQRFLLLNHVTSSCMSPRSPFSTWSAVSPSKSHDFRLYEPAIPFFPLVRGIPSHFRS